MDVDAWVESRILWKARHALGRPSDRTFRFADLAGDLQEQLGAAAGRRGAGRPVLAFVGSAERWTLLGTEKVVSRHHGRDHAFPLRELVGVTPVDWPMPWWTPERVGQWKAGLEYLCLRRSWWRSAVVWGPPGSGTFALWNILGMFPGIYRAAGRGSRG